MNDRELYVERARRLLALAGEVSGSQELPSLLDGLVAAALVEQYAPPVGPFHMPIRLADLLGRDR